MYGIFAFLFEVLFFGFEALFGEGAGRRGF
jgi:hypothetical protein